MDDHSPESRWLAARVAVALDDHETATTILEELAGKRDDLEDRRLELLVEALASSGRMVDALELSLPLVVGPASLPPAQRVSLLEERAGWLEVAGRHADALAELDAARALATRDGTRERLDLRRAACLIRLERAKDARRILLPLADTATTADTMRKAAEHLSNLGSPVGGTAEQRLARARRLATLRAFDAALQQIEPLLEDRAYHGERARFERAKILFDRRRHYAQAIEALDEVIADGGAHLDEARFMRARALSRLDRDEEAIAAYRDYARKTGNKAEAAGARFLAARLLYYLGRHEEALADIEKIVGRGKARGKNKTRLGSGGLPLGQARDAHFIAGMSALLAGSPARAEDHFLAASEGSESAEARERNRYWHAVSRLEGRKADAPELLRGICAADGTSWYSLWAKRRLSAAGEPLETCHPDRITPLATTERDSEENPAEAKVPSLLEPLSPLAAFFARAGLYRDAATELVRAESGGTPGDRRAWITAYLAVDAPHRAVRVASRQLTWPPQATDLWRARAAYPEPFLELTVRVERERGLPRHLIAAIARKESLFDPRAVSHVGALGMMQMMPHTYETNRVLAGLPPLKPRDIPGPEHSIQAAGYELEWLLQRFCGSLPLAIMGYNGGAAAVDRWLERSGGLPMDVFVEKAGFAQTRNYVRRVYKNLVRYRLLDGAPLPELPAVAEKTAAHAPGGLPCQVDEAKAGITETDEQTGDTDE